MSLFVGNLSAQVQHQELEHAFRRFGRSNLELKDGYGFVIYEASRDAERALRALQGKTVCGERPSITWARRQRPFQSLSNKGVFFRRVSREKEQGFMERGLRRRHSPALNKVCDNEQNENRASDEEEEPRDGSRSKPGQDANGNGANKGGWKDLSTADLVVDVDEQKEPNPLDAGRWGEGLSEGSPDHDLVEETRNYEEDLRDREKEDIEVAEKDVREKLHESPTERSFERPVRAYRNTEDQSRRGRDSLTKSQERCYNCGQLGHIMRQCRSRPNVNMFPRDGFDGRRFQYRGLRGSALRRPSGRFRGIDGPRWGPNRDMDPGYGRRTIRRTGSGGDNRIYEQEDVASRGKNRHQHRQSDSYKDSQNRDKSKKGHKRSRKRSGSRPGHKRHRPSVSQSKSDNHSRSSSSSPSRAHSPSPHSQSRSSKSHSRSSSSHSQSLSHRSRSQSSRSISSRSRTPQSGQSHSFSSKSRSMSLSQSKSPVHSQSHDSQGLLSHSTPLGGNSKALHGSSPEQHARSQVSRELLLPDESRSGPEHSTAADQDENQGVLYHLSSEKSLYPEESEERHPSKKQKFNDTEITKFKYQEVSGESKREDVASMLENVNDFRYILQDQEKDKDMMKITGHSFKEKSGHGFRENMEGIIGSMGHKSGDGSLLEMEMVSNSVNSMVNFHRECVQEHGSKQNASAHRPMDAIFSKDAMAATHQERSALSLGTAVTSGALHREAEQEGISLRTSETQKLVHRVYISVMKENLKKGAAQDCDVQELEAHSFSAARLWTWEAVLYRRIKRGPISVANYDRRQAQNDQFHITDKFVRSSSGWWEKSELFFD